MEYDKRKIIKVGEKSYAVTLPKRWCSELGLRPGEIVDLVYSGSTVLLKPFNRRHVDSDEGRVYIEISNENEYEKVISELAACYVEGVTHVKLKGDPVKVTKLTSELSNYLTGVVAVGGVKSSFTELRFPEGVVELEEVIDRIFSLLDEALTLILEIMRGERGDETRREVILYLKEARKLYYVGMRGAKEKSILSSSEEVLNVIDHILFLKNVKQAIEVLLKILETSVENLGSLFEAFLKVSKLLKDSMSAYLEKNIDKALEVLSRKNKAIQEIERLKGGACILINLSDLVEVSVEIAEVVLGKCVRDRMCRCRYFYPKIK